MCQIIISYLSFLYSFTTFSLLIIVCYLKIVAQKVMVLNFLTEYQWYSTMSCLIAITTCLFHLYLFSVLGRTLSYSSPHMIHGRRFQTIQKALRSKRFLHNASKILSFITMPNPILPHSLWKKKCLKYHGSRWRYRDCGCWNCWSHNILRTSQVPNPLSLSLSLTFCVSLQFGLCTINMIIKMMGMFWRLGIRSLVLESSDELRTAGYALTLWTNAWKALDAVGIGDSLRLQHELLDG